MLDRLGIRSRVLLLALLPAGLMALVLGSYFTWLQQNDLRTQLLQRGKMIAEQLAPLAAPAMARLAPAQLERIAAQTLEQADVRAVAFLAPDRTRLAHAGPSMLNQPPSGGTGTQLLQRTGNDATRYLMPVFGHHRDLATDAVPAEAERLLGWVEIELSHDGTLLRGYRNLFTSLLLILACLALSGLLALRMSRTINDPIERIKHAVNQLKDGHLEERLPTMGSHELDELAHGINRMAETLQNAHEELQHSIDQATEDVRQNLETIEIQNIELDMARKEALEASRIKSEFLANMSHEIRTPFQGMLGMLKLLEDTRLSSEQRDYVQTATDSAHHLLGVVNDILDVSTIESGTLTLSPGPVNLAAMAHEVTNVLEPLANDKGVQMSCLCDEGLPAWVLADPTRVRQILYNLMSNAMKFTQKGSIEVILEADPKRKDGIRMTVQDSGIGMDAATVANLFTRFYQADNTLRRRIGGSGLGLEISRTLARMMDGDITVTSTPGKGSIFVVTLRLPRTTAPAVENILQLDDEAWERRRTPTRRLRLLAAEDHPVNLKYLNLLIDRMGHEAVFCENGFEALQMLNRESFDAVLLDYHMPVLDGIATAAEIRLLPGPAGQVPIIMVTADVVNDTKEKALSAGVTQFAPKPMQEADLRRALRRCGLLEGSADTQPAPLELPKRTQRSMQQLVDAQVHGELLEMMPREMFEQLLDMLFQGPEGTALVLQQALADEDLEAIVYQAHRLKGSCMLLGLRALVAVAADIEKSGQAGDIRTLRDLRETLSADIRDTMAALPEMMRLATKATT